MRCYLREYLALKGFPVIAASGERGALVAVTFREPDWSIASIGADFGRLIHLTPAELECSWDDDVLHVLAAELPRDEAERAVVRADALDVDADGLLGRPILSSSNDQAAGLIKDLLINVRDWCLRYFVVDNGERRTLLDAGWVTGLSADASVVIVNGLPSRALITAPEYPGVEELTPGFEDTIYRHYTNREFAHNST